MSPLDAAREFAAMTEADLRELIDYRNDCGFCGGFMLVNTVSPSEFIGYEHYADCLWLARQKIVAALEAAGQTVALFTDDGSFLDRDGNPTVWTCTLCLGHGRTRDTIEHTPTCRIAPLGTALKGSA